MKYYVTSGELQKIVSANSSQCAVEKALNNANGETISPLIYVDEHGFRDGHDPIAENIFLLNDIIETIGEDNEEYET